MSRVGGCLCNGRVALKVVFLSRDRQPNERLAISENNHNKRMNESEVSIPIANASVNYIKPFADLTGRKFGRWLVIGIGHRIKNGEKWLIGWRCKCECGNEKVVTGGALRSGHSKSCGCFMRNGGSALGYSKPMTKEYKAWASIQERCYNPKNKRFKDYGGRGVVLCDRWRDFRNFLIDMGHAPPGFQLERTDNDGNYEKSNCKWASRVEQGNNKRNNRRIEFDGKTQTASQWAMSLNLKVSTIYSRLDHGWSVKDALTRPVQRRTCRFTP